MSKNHRNISLNQQAQYGFTLIELTMIIAVVGILVGVLFPAVQKLREVVNAQRAKVVLGGIKTSEESFRAEIDNYSGTYTGDFRKLGLSGAPVHCLTPNCDTMQRDGYLYQLVLAPDAKSFTAIARPAVVGKTGSTKCLIDQTGSLSCAPLAEAEAVHKQMFDNINGQAIETLSGLILQRPADFQQITDGCESRRTSKRAFDQLDVNGDGKVTFTEIINYGGIGSDAIRNFLDFVGNEMQLGAGDEDVGSLPGVSFNDLEPIPVSAIPNPSPTPSHPPQNNNGIASLTATLTGIANDPTAVEYLPAFGDGSVRFGDGGASSQGNNTSPTGSKTFTGTFFGTLSRPDLAAPSNPWRGVWTLTDQSGNSVNGILIGLLQPSSSGPSLRALVVATNSVGDWNGINGNGDVTINWGDQTLNGPFRGRLRLVGSGEPTNNPNDVNH